MMDAYYNDDLETLEKIVSDQALAILTGDIRQRKEKVINKNKRNKIINYLI